MKLIRNAIAGSLESSDALVRVEIADEHLTVDVESIVIKQFGKDIERAVYEVLKEMGVEAGAVRIQDKGALDCTIRARVETALLRAGEVDA